MNDTRNRIWSPLQNNVFAAVDAAVKARNGDNLTVLARAGSGKTSTIVEAIKRLPKGVRALAVAFNKTIAVELQEKVPQPHEAATLHAAGFKIIRRERSSVRVDKDKAYIHAETALVRMGRCDPDTHKALRSEVNKVAKASQLARETLTLDPQDLQDMVIARDLSQNGDGNEFPVEPFCQAILACIDLSLEDQKTIDFSDMVFLPVHYGWAHRIYDLVIVDEAQDMNKAQLSLATLLVRPKGSIVIVGDDMQAIYSFRGADSGAIQRMSEELNSTVLPLSVSYRCPQAIIRLAQEVCKDIQPSPDAPEGTIRQCLSTEIVSQAKAGDFILSRTNAPLASLCLSLLSKGIPAVIAGRDVGARLVSTVEKSKTRIIQSLLGWLDSYQESELNKLAVIKFRSEEQKEQKEQEIMDLVACIVALSDGLAPTDSTALLIDRIETLFSDSDPQTKVCCSTVHKAKGRERDRVFMLESTFRKGKTPEESRIWYVAVTRAKRELIRAITPKS